MVLIIIDRYVKITPNVIDQFDENIQKEYVRQFITMKKIFIINYCNLCYS